MQQHFFETTVIQDAIASSGSVNVASVPHRSPFRYPGGKTWFVPAFRRWMSSLTVSPRILVEPFAGGATIALTAVCENWVDHAVLIELDSEVSAVWQTIVQGHAPELAQRILNFDLNIEAVKYQLAQKPPDQMSVAFNTILKNRTFHGGILANGSGLIKSGESGKGLTSRWYPQTLAKRLNALHFVRHRLTILTSDALDATRAYQDDKQCVFFVDPPYTAGGKNAGKRLYNHHELNHDALFQFCQTLAGDFVMTYDNTIEVQRLADTYKFKTKLISMKNTHHTNMSEMVIGRSLGWL